MSQAVQTIAHEEHALAAPSQRAPLKILDVYSPGGVAAPERRLDAIATISAGWGELARKAGRDGGEYTVTQPHVSRDGTIHLHDPMTRAPRLKQILAAHEGKWLDIAFPFNDPTQFIQMHFARYSASRLEVYGDETGLTEVSVDGKRSFHPAGSDEFKRILPTCKTMISVYFTGADWVDGEPKVKLWDGLGFYRIRTTARHSIRALEAQIRLTLDMTGGRLAGVPFRLSLDYRDVAAPTGKRNNIPVWTIKLTPPEEIELDMDRFQLVMSAGLQQGRKLLALAAPREEELEDHALEVLALGAPEDEEIEYADFAEMLDEELPLADAGGELPPVVGAPAAPQDEDDEQPATETPAPTPGPAVQATATQVSQLVEGEAPITAKARESYNGAWHATVAGTTYAEEAERAAFLLAYTKDRPGGATDSLAEFWDGSARVRAASEREASGLLVAIQRQINEDAQGAQRERTSALLGGRRALDVLGQDEDYEVVPPRAAPAETEKTHGILSSFRPCTDKQWADIQQWVSPRTKAELKRETLDYETAAQIIEEWKPKGGTK